MGEFSITAIDVLVVIVVLISAVFAMWRGLIHETFTIFEWIAGGLVALRFAPSFQPLLRDVVSPPWLAWIVVFVGTFLIVFIPLSILAHRLSEIVKKSEIGPVDRVLGLIFGIGRGLVIVGIAYIVYGTFVPVRDQSEAVRNAYLFPVIRNASDVLLGFLPAPSERGGESPARAAAQGPAPTPGPARNPETDDGKSYGAGDRRALDNLIEATGGGNSSR